jgi:hypothetical protein
MRRHTHTHTHTRVRSNIMRGYTHTHTHTQQKVPQLLNPMEQSTDRLTIDRATLSAVENKCRYADRQRPKHQTDTLARSNKSAGSTSQTDRCPTLSQHCSVRQLAGSNRWKSHRFALMALGKPSEGGCQAPCHYARTRSTCALLSDSK